LFDFAYAPRETQTKEKLFPSQMKSLKMQAKCHARMIIYNKDSLQLQYKH